MKTPDELMSFIVKEVIKENDKRNEVERKHRKDWRLRNTSLLLKNYRKLKAHCDNVVEDLEVYKDMVYDPKGLKLDTLMQYKTRTAKMLQYFDTIFKAYGEMSKYEGHSAERRYRIVSRMYVENQGASATELSEYYNIDRSTVTRDTTKAIEELSIMLFGIDSFEDLE